MKCITQSIEPTLLTSLLSVLPHAVTRRKKSQVTILLSTAMSAISVVAYEAINNIHISVAACEVISRSPWFIHLIFDWVQEQSELDRAWAQLSNNWIWQSCSSSYQEKRSPVHERTYNLDDGKSGRLYVPATSLPGDFSECGDTIKLY